MYLSVGIVAILTSLVLQEEYTVKNVMLIYGMNLKWKLKVIINLDQGVGKNENESKKD